MNKAAAVNRPLLIILGPTATGKTDLALTLARDIDMEIISADSAQVYRGLDIGTAKPSPAEQRQVPHHLIDIRDPDEEFTAADFQALAAAAIDASHGRGRLPVVVGGTGFYIRSLTTAFPFPKVAPNWELRRALAALAESQGVPHVHRWLAAVDPAAARRLHPNDLQRVIRALEIRFAGGASTDAAPAPAPPYRILRIGLNMARADLHRRIEARSEAQLAAGWLDEVRGLLAAGWAPDCFGLQILGYRQLTEHLLGRLTFAEAKRLLQRDTRRLARRQSTWFRREERVTWLDSGTSSPVELAAVVQEQIAGELLLSSN